MLGDQGIYLGKGPEDYIKILHSTRRGFQIGSLWGPEDHMNTRILLSG